jgi:hypothetical protein
MLAAVTRQRELVTADSIAETLCWRIDRHLPRHTPPPPIHQPTTSDAHRYAALLATIPAFSTHTFSAGNAVTAQ